MSDSKSISDAELKAVQALDPTVSALLDQRISDLAKLAPIDYDMQREATADSYGIRVSTLDAEVYRRRPKTVSNDGGAVILNEPESWPHPVDGVELLDAIQAIFQKYAILPAGAATMLTLWTIHTFAMDAADASPIAAIASPEKRCGKTIVIELLNSLVYRPLPASNITPAALFRTIEAKMPTLLIDEADSFLGDNEELRGVLNSGHRRPTAIIIRTVGDKHEPKTFSTWCPKAIALIGKLPGTLEDRSILITMRRKSRSERVERIRHRVLPNETIDLQQKSARWAADNIEVLKNSDPVMPDSLNDRAADCWRPLVAIADQVGGQWPNLARQAALSLASRDGDSSSNVQLLSDIRDIFDQHGTAKLSSEAIVEELVKLENRPWPEWKNGKPLSKFQLARQLGKFEIVSKTVRISLTSTPKGYERSQFDDAFGRYLEISSDDVLRIGTQNATPPQTLPDLGSSPTPERNTNSDVALSKTPQALSGLTCGVVALSHDPSGDIEEI